MTRDAEELDSVAHWSDVADDWITWARASHHDAFWAYRDALADLIGHGKDSAIDIGCGEGRVSRLLAELGYSVTAVEPVEAMLEAARQAGGVHDTYCATAEALPVSDDMFGLAVLYNVLMDIPDIAAALTEAARVLRPDGRLVIGIVHPLADWLSLDPAEGAGGPTPSYFETRPFAGEDCRDGLSMRFAGWARPLEAYVTAIVSAGFVINGLTEPRPDPKSAEAPWDTRPLFLWITARLG